MFTIRRIDHNRRINVASKPQKWFFFYSNDRKILDSEDEIYFHCNNYTSCGNALYGSDNLCKPCHDGDTTLIGIEESDPIDTAEEQDNSRNGTYLAHCTRVTKKVDKGKKKGMEVVHFDCNYCNKSF